MLIFRGELGIYHLDIPPEVENHLPCVVPRICGALLKEKMSPNFELEIIYMVYHVTLTGGPKYMLVKTHGWSQMLFWLRRLPWYSLNALPRFSPSGFIIMTI